MSDTQRTVHAGPAPRRRRLMLVDDHPAVRDGYRRLLESLADVTVDLQAGDARQAYATLLRAERGAGLPDLVIVDLSLGGATGLALIDRCHRRFPALAMLVFSMHEQPAIVDQALAFGARGFVSKSSQPEALLAAVDAVCGGARHVDPAVDRLRRVDGDADALAARLTPREREIVRQMMRGATLDDVAVGLGLSSKTVANQLSSIRQKAGVANDFQLVQRLAREGMPDL